MHDSIPYFTAREGERDTSDRALKLLKSFVGTVQLAYADETPEDRSDQGVLLARMSQCLDEASQPTGDPVWKHVNYARQRECMTGMLCHYCKGEPSRTDQGILFLDVMVRDRRRAAKPAFPEGFITFQPPLCLPHAQEARDRCTYAQKAGGFTAMRVRDPRLYGAVGAPYQIGAGGSLQPAKARMEIAFNHPQRAMFLATSYSVIMRGATVVDLDHELAAAGQVHHTS